ncbi:had-like protein [Diplodia corticola]|uniref:Had-like protein n=1 Tax=Diplodia corticola TaxID=236234 RepID=A0A1J9RE63_9PEZI|nr:had-like protein [Diplodia corticola]OJD30851.1 had-like protein [Diplodia corticola]
MAGDSVKTIIFDIGDVLCSWVPPKTLGISPKLFKEFRDSHTWYDYDCGKISEDECFARLAAQGGVSTTDVAAAFELARNSLVQNDGVVTAIRGLRAAHPHLRVYAMSNISRPDWEMLRRKPFGWDIFDCIFTSCETGMRKPELRFYRHVLSETGTSPAESVFVDDKPDNIVAAHSLGFREAILFDDAANVRRQLLNLLEDPAQRGRAWISGHAKEQCSETDRGDCIDDNFAQLLAYEAMGDGSLLNHRPFDRTWNYFAAPLGMPQKICDDVDTTSYAFKVLQLDNKMAHSIMDEMMSAEQRTADGIVKVYFDKTNSRTDAAVCINVVRLHYKFGRGNEPGLQATKAWIQDVLFFRGYMNGTRYYPQPEVYLYFFARLLVENRNSDLFRSTAALLRERLMERINSPADSLGLAMRVLACHYMGIRDEMDLKRLLTRQQEDGSFGLGWLCSYGKTQVKVGSRVLTTALAVAAVEALTGSGVKAAQQGGTRAPMQYGHGVAVPASA